MLRTKKNLLQHPNRSQNSRPGEKNPQRPSSHKNPRLSLGGYRTGYRKGSDFQSHSYVQRLIFSEHPLNFVAGLVGDLRGEGSDTTVAREIFICPA